MRHTRRYSNWRRTGLNALTAIAIMVPIHFISATPAAVYINECLTKANAILNPSLGTKNPDICGSTEEGKWRANGFINPVVQDDFKIQSTKAPIKPIQYEFDLDIVVFRNCGWSEDLIKERYARVAHIYSQCGVGLGQVRLVTLDPPNNQCEVEHIAAQDEKGKMGQIAAKSPSQGRNVVYHVGKFSDDTSAISFAELLLDEAVGRYHSLINSAWVSSIVTSETYKSSRLKNLLPEAHELGHVLFNCGHSAEYPKDDPLSDFKCRPSEDKTHNLMAHYVDERDDQLTKGQCEMLEKRAKEKNPVLREVTTK